jgi:hypothetical protein
MKTRTLPYIALAVTGACGPAGRTVDLVSQTPAAIVLEYTHVWSEELPAAMRIAETRCQQYGRHARMNGEPKRLNADRSVAVFDCVP